jgi:hypothetical protein
MTKTPFEALVLAYYLARLDDVAVKHLGFEKQRACLQYLGEFFGIPHQTIKLRRDDFDQLFDHRLGFYQTKLAGSKAKVAELLQEADDEELHQIIDGILNGDILDSDHWKQAQAEWDTSRKDRGKRKYSLRGPTGKKAEKAFEKYHAENGEPVEGRLVDCRDNGCGYDYEIQTGDEIYYVEVKGLDGFVGGITFTSKEWVTARKYGNRYFVAVARNVGEEPIFQFIVDPVPLLTATRQVIRPVQVRWNISHAQLASIDSET